MHWDWKKDYFCITVCAIHMLFFFGTSPALLGYILDGYVENMAKLTICIISGLGFFALAMTMAAVHSFAYDVIKARRSSGELDTAARSQTPDDHQENKSISFNEPSFRKNKAPEKKAPEKKAPESVSENEDKTDGWHLL